MLRPLQPVVRQLRMFLLDSQNLKDDLKDNLKNDLKDNLKDNPIFLRFLFRHVIATRHYACPPGRPVRTYAKHRICWK